MSEEIKEPKDLGVKMGTKEEADWARIKEVQEETIRKSKINIAISEKILQLASLEIIKEKEIWKRMGKKPNYVG